MLISEHFDVVIMLTWSDWESEPRSNRYHFATRFARELPVLFVQPSRRSDRLIAIEPTQFPNIELVHAGQRLGPDGADEFLALLRTRGFIRPLVWIYNTEDYQLLIEGIPHGFHVYHATEDYLTDIGRGATFTNRVGESVVRTLPFVDMLIGVSANVVKSYQTNAKYTGPIAIVENGCDSRFYFDLLEQMGPIVQPERHIAIFQGGINRRLDFRLLLELVSTLPDWDFWFCGTADENHAGWKSLVKEPNVKYYGNLKPEDFGKLMCQATVGIIPFTQNQFIFNLLPLKAYEYVSCGLPVVTVPIAALERESDLFTSAKTAKEFAVAMRKLAAERFDAARLDRRREAAAANSYDARFAMMSAELVKVRNALSARPKCLNAVLLYSEAETRISTIYEHIDAFKKYSVHDFQFMPAVGRPYNIDEIAHEFDLSIFDVLILHYSVRLSLPDHLSEVLAKKIERFRGLKILFIQDEYEGTETARCWMDRLNFQIVYTCVPANSREQVYPSSRYPTTEFLPTLTGYVAEDSDTDQFVVPIADRRLLIAYRGRRLPFIYGTLGHEKYRIGLDVRRLAEERGLPVDIEVDDSKRIYGPDWFRFLGSARATLGTESGSNVFDFDGTVQSKIEAITKNNPNASFEHVRDAVLRGIDGSIRMNQVSPKIFEAIRMRTALVLFEGSYSDTVKPGLHYIPLKKDYSNIEEIFEKLQDIEYLNKLTARAYADVIESGLYSYRSFVQSVDRDISRRLLRGPTYQHFCSTTMVRARDGSVRLTLPNQAAGFTLSNQILGGVFQRKQVIDLVGDRWRYVPPERTFVSPATTFVSPDKNDPTYAPIFSISQKVMLSVLRKVSAWEESQSSFAKFLRYCFRRVPPGIRNGIIRSLELMSSKAR